MALPPIARHWFLNTTGTRLAQASPRDSGTPGRRRLEAILLARRRRKPGPPILPSRHRTRGRQPRIIAVSRRSCWVRAGCAFSDVAPRSRRWQNCPPALACRNLGGRRPVSPGLAAHLPTTARWGSRAVPTRPRSGNIWLVVATCRPDPPDRHSAPRWPRGQAGGADAGPRAKFTAAQILRCIG